MLRIENLGLREVTSRSSKISRVLSESFSMKILITDTFLYNLKY